METIRSALAAGQGALSEYAAKALIRSYGVPVVAEERVQTVDEAVDAAARIGWPVALKACGAEILHKTEAGLLALHLADETALRSQWDRIQAAAGSQTLDGMLVQAMAGGDRELVVGMTREPQFGPCVMVGLGGILTEVLRDAAFRVAPFDTVEALDMIEELRCRDMLRSFRGTAPADLDTLCRVLVGVGRLAAEAPEIREIDINPVVIDAEGRIAAVDALVLLESDAEDDPLH